MLAVIEAAGKQYLVKNGDCILLNKLIDGEEIIFDKILLYYDGKQLFLGKPFLTNVKVKGRLIKQFKNKIKIIKFRPKTRYKKKVGYKNYFSQVKIEDFIFS